ncbi:MAG: hypothetical protein OEY28_09115 [Nitrospira sp.]|nr:hypothetical protein [Nitrospira sp.]
MPLLSHAEYLGLGRQIALLLGGAMQSPMAHRLRELAWAYDPAADESRISAEVFLFNKYLLMQACVGVFPQTEVDYVVGGLVAALHERARDLDFNEERQSAIEQVWQARAGEFEQAFICDREQVSGPESADVYWKHMINRFCRNVREFDNPPDIWAGTDGPSHVASRSVTTEFDRMISALGELDQRHFSGTK